MAITIDGQVYKVVETLPYQGMGKPSKIVATNGGEKVVFRDRYGKWQFWIAANRMGLTPQSLSKQP